MKSINFCAFVAFKLLATKTLKHKENTKIYIKVNDFNRILNFSSNYYS